MAATAIRAHGNAWATRAIRSWSRTKRRRVTIRTKALSTIDRRRIMTKPFVRRGRRTISSATSALPCERPTGAAAIGKTGSTKGKGSAGSLQDAAGVVAVLDVGGVHLDRRQATLGVGQDMALASMDPLSGVAAFGPSPFRPAVRTIWL